MSGQSDKKNKKKSQSANQITLIFIGIATGLYIIMNLYSIIFKGKQITKGQIFGFIVLNIINYLLYTLIDNFRGSYWEKYLIDLLGMNLFVEVMINVHYKFWYLYLIYPAYGLIIGGKKLYAYVKTIGQEDPNEGEMEPTPQNKPKQKVKYMKAK
jgi:hypothetical protein